MNNTDEGMTTMTTVSLLKDPLAINDAARTGVCAEALLAMGPRIELNFAINLVDHADDAVCEGHESLRGDRMGMADYCNGSCRPAWTPLIRL